VGIFPKPWGERRELSKRATAITFADTSERDARRAQLKAECDGGKTAACVELDQP
jgi:hypothetical protein